MFHPDDITADNGVSLDDLIASIQDDWLSPFFLKVKHLVSIHLLGFTEEELAFIRCRGTEFGEACLGLRKVDAAEAIADGWAIVEGGLNAKGFAQTQAQKAARIFLYAAWLKWYQNKSLWRRMINRINSI